MDEAISPVSGGSASAPARAWPADDEVRRVRPAPEIPAEDTTPRAGQWVVPDVEGDLQAAAYRDNRPAGTKRWLPLVVPLIAVMLAVCAGSIMLLET